MDVIDARARVEAVLNDFIDGLEDMPTPPRMDYAEFQSIVRQVVMRTHAELRSVTEAYLPKPRADAAYARDPR